MSWDSEGFREKLESEHSFPGEYMFKFIVPTQQVKEVEMLWTEGHLTKRESSNGNYVSVTIRARVENPEDVIAIYRSASLINGLIAL
jgi:putative lipoic acid-binding regulatory protein